MHDFRCRNAEDMFYKPLSDGVRHFKETKEGRAKMSKDIEKYADEKAILEVVQAYRAAKFSDEEIKKYIMERFHLEEADAEKYVKLVPTA